MTTENTDNAISQAKAQLSSIIEMVNALVDARAAEDDKATEAAEQTIHEDALSVEVRSGWYSPVEAEPDTAPTEYRILLCTGGPAVQIQGDLSEHGEPETAEIYCQDWFTPWSRVATDEQGRDAMLIYAQCFYYGEG
jgi:hypothetical protein